MVCSCFNVSVGISVSLARNLLYNESMNLLSRFQKLWKDQNWQVLHSEIETLFGLLVVFTLALPLGIVLSLLIRATPVLGNGGASMGALSEQEKRIDAGIIGRAHDHIILKFNDTDPLIRDVILNRHALVLGERIGDTQMYRVSFDAGRTPEGVISELYATESAHIAFAEVDAMIPPSPVEHLLVSPPASIFDSGRAMITDQSRGDGVIIALVGTNVSHEGTMLAGNVLPVKSIFGDGMISSNQQAPSNMVANILLGAEGIVPNTKLLPVIVSLRPDGVVLSSDLAEGIFLAYNQSANIVHVSYPLHRSWVTDEVVHTAERLGAFVVAPLSDDDEGFPHGPGLLLTSPVDAKNISKGVAVKYFGPDVTAFAGYRVQGKYYEGAVLASSRVAGSLAFLIGMKGSTDVSSIRQIFLASTLDKGAEYYDTTYGWGSVAPDNLENSIPQHQSDELPPSSPTQLLCAQSSDGRVLLSWNPSVDDSFSVHYRIYRNGQDIAETEKSEWYDDVTQKGKTFEYAIRARDTAGNTSLLSADCSVFVGQMTHQNTPTSVEVIHRGATDAHVRVTTSVPQRTKLRLTESPEGLWYEPYYRTKNSLVHDFFLTGLTPQTSYTFVIEENLGEILPLPASLPTYSLSTKNLRY